ncbi:TlpA family protein disulfide reductase [Aquihabitans sp. G128]|uniref:TlpA family protein disulfide reductase n=1 Tax=Aquihabitans sp. G128 TaxID=2849779 RepID=UPI001C22A268|nr:TlpA disulfide reductase family protein [Aquihabitans sp. G128]QXC60644.1 TlpA family protein disulfide reductase [Aquihabitans sp. G128]
MPADLDGEPLLATPLALPGSDSLTLAELAGSKMVIINFWAKWCAPCVAEMPILEQVHRTDDRVVFVGVNERDPAEQATAMARRTKITYRWVLDPRGDLAAEARTINLPTTLMISADGQVLAAKVGAFHSVSELERWIASGMATP